MNSSKRFEKLIQDMSNCSLCLNFPCASKSLINIYKDYNFCTNIPSIWTDWFNRLDSNIMIIGQDWGPYIEMKKINGSLEKDKLNWKELIESEKSLTKKMLEKFIIESSKNKYNLNDCFITNAIMCARQGNNYRGNNIDLKNSTINCSRYLERQIEIVKPRVVLTLGLYPLISLSKIYGFGISNTLKETIKRSPEIHLNNFIVIPLYHPAAQIRKEEQLEQYKRIWKHLENI